MPMASPRPIVRARSRCAAGRRCTSTEMNTTLSMPSTISMTVRVSRAIHASGLVSHSMTQRVSGLEGSAAGDWRQALPYQRMTTRSLPVLDIAPPAPGPTGHRGSVRARRRAARRVPARAARPARVLRLDARLPDEQERLRGDGGPAARRGLRRGAVDGRRGPRRDQHLRDPRGGRGEGHRAPGAPRPAQGRQPVDAGRDDRLLGARVEPRRARAPLSRRWTCSCGRTRSRSWSTGSGSRPRRRPWARRRTTAATTLVKGAPVSDATHLVRARADAIAGGAVSRGSAISAWLPIIYGCDKTCTYCIVPFSRGPERSRPFDEIVDEARALAAAGLPRGHAARPERQQLRPRPAPRAAVRARPHRAHGRAATRTARPAPTSPS